MNILIACEASQTIANAYRNKGYNAYSCDIGKCYGGHPEYHIQGDCLKIINGYCWFITQDGIPHNDVLSKTWDMIIAHPPCTYLSKAGACNLFDFYGNIKDFERYNKGLEAKEFFLKILSADTPKLCVENPVPLKIYNLPQWTQIIEPYYFGDNYSKKTCLWLKGLPPLQSTNILNVDEVESWTLVHSSARLRSKTFPGIAEAIVNQWHENAKPIQLSIFD